MSELNINDLPSEVIIMAFRFLDAANLKNATLACKLWKNLIESSCRWSLSLELVYDQNNYNSDAQKMESVLATDRKFDTIMTDSVCDESRIFEIFEKHGFHVVKLYLSKGHMDSLDAFIALLKFSPNLKYVDIRFVALTDADYMSERNLPNLKKLTNLEMHVDDYRFTRCFRKAKLTTIKICEMKESEHRNTLAPFILSQNMLTSLTAESYSDSPSVLAEIGQLDVPIPFRLTQLAISDGGNRNSTHNKNLLKFVKSQTDSVTEIEIGDGISSSVFECVFASMNKLKTLGVVLHQIPQDNDFYERLQENGNVCTMKILNIELELSCEMQYFGGLLKKLPNIRNLFVSNSGCTYDDILAVAAQNTSQIEFLHMDSIGAHSFDDIGRVNFSNLKTLHIGYLYVRIDWNQFIKMHSRLVELAIEEMEMNSFLTSDDIDQISTNVDLRSLKLGFGFVADDRFFEIIGIKCPNLKVLDLHKSCVSNEFDHNKSTKLLRLVDELEWSTYSQMLNVVDRPT